MAEMRGFTADEAGRIRDLMARFVDDGHPLDELVRIERAEMPGYNGRVVPRLAKAGGFEITMLLSCCAPFTIAHELGHIADIRARRQETVDHLSLAMPTHWHLAHRMSSEYTANRMACAYVDEDEVFTAFRSDHVGLLTARRDGDWASFLVCYALLLGLFHGLKRNDCDPIGLLNGDTDLPASVTAGLEGFRAEAAAVFAETWKDLV